MSLFPFPFLWGLCKEAVHNLLAVHNSLRRLRFGGLDLAAFGGREARAGLGGVPYVFLHG